MIGTSIGPYRVTSALGEGGMGQVFRAHDERLDRDVALKVLPETFAANADRLQRFEREAKLLASLDHPSIATLHALEAVSGRYVLVMELVEGEDLSERLRRGPLDVNEAVGIAVQIAEALAAAHDRGIVHRDLKPANVRLRPDGRIKVLDFGLAKAWRDEAPAADPSQSPTLTHDSTEAGVLLGTAGYMSPEQARGRAVDRRADVWSFGVILWEMLSGERLFDGPTVSDVLASLLTREPDPADLPPTVPQSVRRVLRGCLERDLERRFRDAGDLALLLRLEEAPSATDAPAARPLRLWIAAGFVLATLVGWAAARWLAFPANSEDAARAPLALSVLEPEVDPSHSFDLSPDGASIALTMVANGAHWIAVRRLDEFDTRPVPHTEGGFNPFYSPDGGSLGFLTRTGLHTVSLDGSVPQTRLEFRRQIRFDPWDSGSNPTAAWLPDGRIVLSTGHWRGSGGRPGLLLVSPGGEVEELTDLGPESGEYQHMNPEMTPDGRHVLFTNRRRLDSDRIEVVDLDSRERRVLLTDAAEGHLVDGRYLVHVRDFYSKVGVVPIDDNLEVTGPPKILFDDVSPYTSTALQTFGGVALVYRRGGRGGGNQRIVELDRNGAVVPLAIRSGDWMQPRLSPDGTKLLLRELGDDCTLWQVDLRRQVLSRITAPTEDYHDGIWGADGRSVLAGHQAADASRRLVRFPARGRGTEEVLDAGRPEAGDAPTSRFPSSVSTDGRLVLFTELGADSDLDVRVLDTETGASTAVAATSAMELGGAISPRGDWIAYASDEGGREEIFLVDWPGLERRIQVSDQGGAAPFWARDGGTLFYVRGDQILEVALDESGEDLRLGQAREVLRHRMGPEGWWVADVFPDGDRFVVVSPVEDATEELRVVTGFAERLDRLFADGG